MDILFILGRILFGGFFIMNGFNHFKHMDNLAAYAGSKGVQSPRVAVGLTGAMIFLGGLGVVLGIYTQISLILISIFLLGVSFKMHNYWTLKDMSDMMNQRINFNKNMALLGAALMMLAIPTPWLWTLF